MREAAAAAAPPPPKTIGMANPASVYCSKGGNRFPVQTPQGVRTECKLPSGETLDEWALWRRDHPAKS
jgi:putative hemolysin